MGEVGQMTANDEATSYARSVHDRAPDHAGQLLAKENAMVFSAACDDHGMPTRIAVIRLDGSVAFETVVDERHELVLADLDTLVREAKLIWTNPIGPVQIEGIDLIDWDRPTGMGAAIRLLNRDGSKLTSAQARRYRWLHVAWRSAGSPYANWFAEPLPQAEREPTTVGPVWSWVGKHFTTWLKERTDFAPELYQPRQQPLPGATGDPVADARRIVQVLRDVADRTAPTSPVALFA
jgi:hypothetical protein